jgi:hypothetical protein
MLLNSSGDLRATSRSMMRNPECSAMSFICDGVTCADQVQWVSLCGFFSSWARAGEAGSMAAIATVRMVFVVMTAPVPLVTKAPPCVTPGRRILPGRDS